MAAVREHVWPLVEAKVVRPVVHQVLPIEQAGAGHRVLEDGGQVGKVVLQVR